MTWEKARAIREEYSPIPYKEPTQADLAEKYNVTQGMVSQVLNDKCWTENEHAPPRD